MLVYGKYKCAVMQMLYVCVLYASCGSPQCCILHDLQFVNASRGCKRQPYGKGSKRHSLHAVDLSQRYGVKIVSTAPSPSNGGPITV